MKHKMIVTFAMLACLGFAQQALAVNQQDLEQLRATAACPRCDLSGADFANANLTGVNLRDANLKGANFTQANLRGADLTGADLTGAVLNNTNLSGASLTGALMKSASLENADLSFASLMSTNLEATTFKGATTIMTNFKGSYFRLTTQPNGVVTSDKPYGGSLQRDMKRDCNKFKLENTRGSVCSTEQSTESVSK